MECVIINNWWQNLNMNIGRSSWQKGDVNLILGSRFLMYEQIFIFLLGQFVKT